MLGFVFAGMDDDVLVMGGVPRVVEAQVPFQTPDIT